MSILIESDANPKDPSHAKRDPHMSILAYAVYQGYTTIVKLLLRSESVDPEGKLSFNRNATLIEYALSERYFEITKLLQESQRMFHYRTVVLRGIKDLGMYQPKELDLSGEGLNDKCISQPDYFLEPLKKLTSLSKINLSHNQIRFSGYLTLFHFSLPKTNTHYRMKYPRSRYYLLRLAEQLT